MKATARTRLRAAAVAEPGAKADAAGDPVGQRGTGADGIHAGTISPEQLGMSRGGQDGLLDHFEVSLFTEGWTQIFSTTFVMWAARQAIRRAEPVTLLAHFTPRQRQRPMNELIEGKTTRLELDPQGSLLDADMAAYYTWLDQQRLLPADESSFLVWFEGHNEVLTIAPWIAARDGIQQRGESTAGTHVDLVILPQISLILRRLIPESLPHFGCAARPPPRGGYSGR